MVIYIDPKTRKRYTLDKRSYDFQYDMDGDSSISEEVVPVIGDWEDYTGSQIINSRLKQINYGRSNELFGTDAGIQGEKLPDLDETGNNKQTTRRRVKRMLVKI